jgi:hypothetical protein
MPVFKEIEDATQQLIAIREVARGKMSHPELTQEKAQAIYQKYGFIIEKLISIGLEYQYLAAMAMGSREMKDSKLENVVLQVGGKSLVIFGATGTLISNIFSDSDKKVDLKDAWNAPNDIIKAKQKAIQNYNNALKDVQNCYINIGKDFAQIADAIMKDDTVKLNSALASLKDNINSLERLGEKLGIAMEELNFNKAAVDGATGVIKAFVTEVAVTIATMGATSAATSVVSEGLAEVTSTATGVGRVLPKVLPKVFNIIKKIERIPYVNEVAHIGKGYYEGKHAKGKLEEDLERNEQAYREKFVPKIAGLD